MKITFTGISREEAIRKLQAKAVEHGKFADRMAATYGADNPTAVNNRHLAEQNTEVARLIAAADSDTVHMTKSDETCLCYALVDIAPGYDTHNLYRVKFEEDDKIPGLIAFANALNEGAREAAKTAKM